MTKNEISFYALNVGKEGVVTKKFMLSMYVLKIGICLMWLYVAVGGSEINAMHGNTERTRER